MVYKLTGQDLLKQLVEEAKEICVGNDVERIPCAEAFIEVFGEDVKRHD
jgi:hypothetical protein